MKQILAGKPFGRIFLLSVVFLVSSGCRETLLTGLSEHEANEVIDCLSRRGIEGSKKADGSSFSVKVDGDRLADAWRALRASGLPKPRHRGIDKVFEKQGLVPGRLEQRALFLAARQEELAETLESIDGVLRARVHLSVSDRTDRFVKDKAIASASVVLSVRGPGEKLKITQDQIRNVVSHAVSGLDAHEVSVVIIPGEEKPLATASQPKRAGIASIIDARFFSAIGAVILITLSLGTFFLKRRRAGRKARLVMP